MAGLAAGGWEGRTPEGAPACGAREAVIWSLDVMMDVMMPIYSFLFVLIYSL